jgi:hypothetical protein
MNLNLTKNERRFLFIKHLKEGESKMDSKNKVESIQDNIRKIKLSKRLELKKEKDFVLNFKKEFNKLK